MSDESDPLDDESEEFSGTVAPAGGTSPSGAVTTSVNVSLGIAATYSSALPPAHDLDAAELYSPGVTNRLVKLAEDASERADKEQDHRHEMERADSNRRTAGLVIAPAMFLSSVGAGCWLAVNGAAVVAGILLGATIVGVVGLLVVQRWWPAREIPSLDEAVDEFRELGAGGG